MLVRLAEAAQLDLADIEARGTASFGAASAAAYLRGLASTMTLIGDYPAIGTVKATSPEVRVRPYQSHVVVYVVLAEADEVLVLRVRHGREDWLEDLRAER